MARTKKTTKTNIEELAPELTPAVEISEVDVMATEKSEPEEIEETIKEVTPVVTEDKTKKTMVKSTKKITTKTQSLSDFLF